MDVSEKTLEGNITQITLSGRMDHEGVSQIDTRFSGMAAAPRMAIIVDMEKVPFLASLGIRLLLINARAVSVRGGKMALLNVERNVAMVLEIAGIDKVIPVYHDIEAAKAAVLS